MRSFCEEGGVEWERERRGPWNDQRFFELIINCPVCRKCGESMGIDMSLEEKWGSPRSPIEVERLRKLIKFDRIQYL